MGNVEPTACAAALARGGVCSADERKSPCWRTALGPSLESRAEDVGLGNSKQFEHAAPGLSRAHKRRPNGRPSLGFVRPLN
eukprot:8731603-Pyramimonas_sp.AAC.1